MTFEAALAIIVVLASSASAACSFMALHSMKRAERLRQLLDKINRL
jgi:hypothetical protein